MTTGKLDSNAAIQYGEYPFFTCARETYKINNYAFDTEAVLLGGNNANGIFPLKYYHGKFNAYQRTYIIESLDQNILLTRYLFYALKPALSHFQNASIGATTQYLTKSILDNFKIKVPDLNSQKAIVNILSKYDDLIENNRRRIELLERSARLLYKEWFVRLRFPGHEHTPIIDGIPEGWEKRPLSQICYDVRDSIKPQDLSPDMAYIGLEHMPRRSIALSEWGNAEDLQSNKFKFKKDDIIFGKIRPYFHKVGVACIDGVTSSDAIVIRSYNPQMYYYCLMLVSSDRFISITSQTVKEGSKMPRANWEFLLKNKFPVPSDALLKIFADTITPIIEQIKLLVIQIQKLKQARDILLPKLMNGEIEV
ncbi:MAG: restriction endonuclease subunit S [Microcystis sp. M015S2]|nr:restriction endonuclease subunit S [Microcystis sp. M025S2]MCA2743370.1 restriction endonuclease subunit S [Microcystis sp. M015S2]MCA2757677.1 restriction endonuclease subunit S [Microcystis sp. M145S2]